MPDVTLPKLSEIRAWHRTNLGVDNNGAALLAALDAVLALHEPEGDPSDSNCEECGEDYPCCTVARVREHVDVEG